MRTLVGIALLILLAVIATSPRFLRLRRATLVGALVSGGWLGVGAGVLIGPDGLGLLAETDAARAAPALTVGLGWIGLMIGLQLRWEVLTRVPRRLYARTALDAGVSCVVLGAGAWAALRLAPLAGLEAGWVWPVAVFIGAASVGWAAEARSLKLGAGSSAEALLALRTTAGLAAPIAVMVAGLAIAGHRASGAGSALEGLGVTALRVVALAAVSVVLGVVARFGLRRARESRPDLLAIFLGVVALISGSAVELRVSPLLASMLAGVVIANLAGPELRKFERFILEAEHVVAVLYAVVAGALLDASPAAGWVALAAAIVALRALLKPWALRRAPVEDAPATARLVRLAPIRQSPVALMLGVELVVLGAVPAAPRVLASLALAGLVCDLAALAAGRLRAGRGADATGSGPVEAAT